MANKNDSKQLISEMKEMLNKSSKRKMTLEGLVYGEDGEEMMNDQMGAPAPEGNAPMPGAPEQQGQMQGQAQMPGMENKEPNALDGDPEITKLITNIRVQTLEGLRRLAETPESPQYDLLKKIFLLVDKAVEDKVDPEK